LIDWLIDWLLDVVNIFTCNEQAVFSSFTEELQRGNFVKEFLLLWPRNVLPWCWCQQVRCCISIPAWVCCIASSSATFDILFAGMFQKCRCLIAMMPHITNSCGYLMHSRFGHEISFYWYILNISIIYLKQVLHSLHVFDDAILK